LNVVKNLVSTCPFEFSYFLYMVYIFM